MNERPRGPRRQRPLHSPRARSPWFGCRRSSPGWEWLVCSAGWPWSAHLPYAASLPDGAEHASSGQVERMPVILLHDDARTPFGQSRIVHQGFHLRAAANSENWRRRTAECSGAQTVTARSDPLLSGPSPRLEVPVLNDGCGHAHAALTICHGAALRLPPPRRHRVRRRLPAWSGRRTGRPASAARCHGPGCRAPRQPRAPLSPRAPLWSPADWP